MKSYFIGLLYLILSKIKYKLLKYTPKPIANFNDCIEYDISVVNHWSQHAKKYFNDFDINGKTVVEIGPGQDLGIALILIAKGAKKYYAFDIHNLILNIDKNFYETIANKIEIKAEFKPSDLVDMVTSYSKTGNGVVNYICKPQIDYEEIDNNDVDIVFSQAALEHLTDIQKQIQLLSRKCKKDSLFIAEVDLRAHSRWVRDHDPLNIYLYNNFIYNIFRHKASPNRIRPVEYISILQNNGWKDIKIIPLTTVNDFYLEQIRNKICSQFLDNEISYLTILLVAKKR